jgi:hypothetical protein
MSTQHVSPDGLWQWDGDQWVATTQPAPAAEPSNPMALGAGITGLVSLFALVVPFFWLLAVPGTLVALILGLVARQRPGRRGWAMTGIVTGALGLLLGSIGMVGVIAAFTDLSNTLNDAS